MKYHFYTAGFIPGIPGIFSGVIVDVDDTTNTILNVSPLHASNNTIEAVQTSEPLNPPSSNPSETNKE